MQPTKNQEIKRSGGRCCSHAPACPVPFAAQTRPKQIPPPNSQHIPAFVVNALVQLLQLIVWLAWLLGLAFASGSPVQVFGIQQVCMSSMVTGWLFEALCCQGGSWTALCSHQWTDQTRSTRLPPEGGSLVSRPCFASQISCGLCCFIFCAVPVLACMPSAGCELDRSVYDTASC